MAVRPYRLHMRRGVNRLERRRPREYSLAETLVATGGLLGGVLFVLVALSYPLLAAGFAGGLLLRPVLGRARTAARGVVRAVRRTLEETVAPTDRRSVPRGE